MFNPCFLRGQIVLKFPFKRVPKGDIDIPSDLLVEVLSPNDLASEAAVKVEESLDAGVLLVWVISPDAETVTAHRADGTVTKLHNTDVLTGEGVLPGFQCKVSELFVATEDAASKEA